MSLINDALRRAKQTQQVSPPPTPPPSPNFRPVEPASRPARDGLSLVLPVSFALVAMIALMLMWQLWKRGASTPSSSSPSALNVAARSLPPEPVQQPAEPAVLSSTQAASGPSTKPQGNTQESASTASEHMNAPASLPAPPAGAAVNNAAHEADTNRSLANEPAPPPLKLQGIVYNPRRPSAMINGHVVFVGEKIRDSRVTAIHADSVVLMSPGHTNVLSLEP